MKNIFFTLSAAMLLAHISANRRPIVTENTSPSNSPKQRRATEVSGDPSLALTFFEAFSESIGVHALNTRAAFVFLNANGADWEIVGPSFKGWVSGGEPGTAPLDSYFNEATTDWLYLTSPDGSIPTPPDGFTFSGAPGHVYPTQVCGSSVPLYAAAGPGDHYYPVVLKPAIEMGSGVKRVTRMERSMGTKRINENERKGKKTE